MKKELLLLIRDPGGMALLFLMPLALVVVMALVQDNTFREFQETRLDVLFVDQDRGELGSGIEEALQSGGNIRLITKEEGKILTVDRARTLVQKGRYKAAVIIPAEAGAALRKKTKQTAQAFLASYGATACRMGRVAKSGITDLFDPSSRPTTARLAKGWKS